ncbi:MAG TPA: DUF302 domain-containing protein [Ktedonobacterales bacterium]|jgi:uncharacterized protein (DUF302 family)
MDMQPPADASAPEGIVTKASAFDVRETVTRIEQALTSKGLTLFALIDHSDEAQRVGLPMPETKLLIFGSPRAGTPLMIASPLLALDLPLKALIWNDTQGHTWVSYTSPAWLAQRHHLPANLTGAIAGMEPLIAAAIQP